MSYNAVLDSSIMRKGLPATAGSKMLADFVSPFDATVVTRLEAAGVQIVGRCDIGEFGVDGLFEVKEDRGTRNLSPCLPGNFADSKADFALCNDYTGAVSLAAAKQGLYYIHPTYGSVSRYGLIPAVSSMDQIGVLCKSAEVGLEILRIISGFDGKDGVMVEGAERPSGKWKVESGKLSVLKASQARLWKYSDILPQVMQILCCAEIVNNISRYDGIKFGYRAKGYNGLRELYTKSRTEAFGENVKLAAVIGAMVLSQDNYMRYYDKAMRLRRLIRDSLEFDKCDVITSEQDKGTGSLSWKSKTDEPSLCPAGNLLIPSRLCGLPSLATPEGVYVANVGREDILEAQLLCNMK